MSPKANPEVIFSVSMANSETFRWLALTGLENLKLRFVPFLWFVISESLFQKCGWIIPILTYFQHFSRKSKNDLKWPFGVKIFWQLDGRSIYIAWLGMPNVVEWYPFCPGFNFILKNGRKSYLGPPTVGNFFRAKFRTTLRQSRYPQSLDS